MSNYPKWWDTTITVYNKFQDTITNIIKWYRTVINNCFWKYTNNKVTINDTVLESNTICCRIPEDSRYLEKFKWEQIPNDSMNNYFTLGVGDILIKGDVDDEIDEYKNGKRSSDITKKYKAQQGCMIIEAMSDNSGTSRNNKHYYVSGI